MKTKITILLALLLALVCTAASAQEYYTLPEIREQAAAGWHETYTDKYGRQTAVDIDIQVFGDEKAPVLKIGLPDYQEYTKVENNPYLSVTNVKKRGGQLFARHMVKKSTLIMYMVMNMVIIRRPEKHTVS